MKRRHSGHVPHSADRRAVERARSIERAIAVANARDGGDVEKLEALAGEMRKGITADTNRLAGVELAIALIKDAPK